MGKAKIKGRDHEPVVRRLIAAGWTSTSISSYLAARFGEKVDASTIRLYRVDHREEIEEEHPDLTLAHAHKTFADQNLSRDVPVDVIGALQEMIHMQRARIELDVRHEESMSKLFTSTRSEIKLLADLLEQYHGLLQDWGIVPRSGIEIDVNVQAQVYQPQQVMPLIDLVNEDEIGKAIEFARLVHEKTKVALPPGSPNGHEDS